MTTSSLQSRRTAVMQGSLIRAVHDRKRPTSLNLGLGQPSLPVEPDILEEGIRRMRSGPMGYTANAGLLGLRKLIAAHHCLPGRTDADSVVVTCGAQEAIFAVMAACLDPGDQVIVPDPAFPSYESVALLLGASTVRVPRKAANGFRLHAPDVAAALTSKTRLIVLNAPGNPTGAIDSAADVEQIAKLADRHSIAILSDEIYADLGYLLAPVPSAARLTYNAYLISGLSKSCAMTGFRLGYVVGAPEHMLGVLRAHHMAATCAPVLSQHMAQVVFEDTRWLTAHQPIYQRRRQLALAALKAHIQVPVLDPDGAFYIMVDMSLHCEDSLRLALEILDEVDVITAPGSAFGDTTRSWLRLTFADEPEIFEEAVKRIGRLLSTRGVTARFRRPG